MPDAPRVMVVHKRQRSFSPSCCISLSSTFCALPELEMNQTSGVSFNHVPLSLVCAAIPRLKPWWATLQVTAQGQA